MASELTAYNSVEKVDLASVKVTKSAYKWQLVFRTIFMPVFMALNRGTIVFLNDKDLKEGTSYIIAATHQSRLDAFIQLCVFEMSIFKRLSPFRAMTMNMYFNGGLIEYVLIKMGCYPAKRHIRYPYGIEMANELIDRKQHLYICPEGDLTLPKSVPAKPGVAILAQNPNTMIIPLHISWTRKNFFIRSFGITVGKPFSGKGMTAQKIMDKVYALPTN